MTDKDHRRISDPRIDELLEFKKNTEPQIERILVILDGKPVVNASGEVRRVGGIASDVADLKDGPNRRWSRGEKIAAVSVGSFLAVGMLPTVFGVLRFVAEWVST